MLEPSDWKRSEAPMIVRLRIYVGDYRFLKSPSNSSLRSFDNNADSMSPQRRSCGATPSREEKKK